MSKFRDVVARMAVDAEFARHARAHPDEVARSYDLTADEAQKLLGLADAGAGSGPAPLGARLSKSGIGTGGIASLLAVMGEPPAPAAGNTFVGDSADIYGFNPQPEPPGDPGFTPDPPPEDPFSAEGVGVHDADSVGLYPWPTVEDTFVADTQPDGPSAPGEDEGIIIINTQPADAGAGETAPSDAGDAMIVDDDKLPADDAEGGGVMIIDEGKAPSDADGGGAMIIDDGDAPVEVEGPKLTVAPVKPTEGISGDTLLGPNAEY